jgi:hypothetical protein
LNDQHNGEQLSAHDELLLERCDFLVESQLWPLQRNLNYSGWLSNFTEEEKSFAERLLMNFMYYSNDLTKHLFRFAFNKLSAAICDFRESDEVMHEQWREFLQNVAVTHVTGEDPSPTDSGYHFARLSRQFLGLDASQILTNEQAVEKIYFGDCKTIVFVDDFVGSGNQFCDTWDRTLTIASDTHYSFKRIAEEGKQSFRAFYCPIFCTWKGRAKIRHSAPNVQIVPAHELDQSYSALSPSSRFWAGDLIQRAPTFLENVSKRAGLDDGWRGFHDLALGIAFEHGIPDATLPIYYHESSSWQPLMRRT